MFHEEIKEHLVEELIPFWMTMKDNTWGGYYGEMDYKKVIYKKAMKGCILHSSILCFFSSSYSLLKEKKLLLEAEHAYKFLKTYFYDKERGGVYWSVTYNGKPLDMMKYTCGQAFAIYGLTAYYEASHVGEALSLAMELYELIERKCKDHIGYLEVFDENFIPTRREELSERDIVAKRKTNTLLHLLEAYIELYRITGNRRVKASLQYILILFREKVFQPQKNQLDIFFDERWKSLVDLHSYGHDIEASWVLEYGCEMLGNGSDIKNIDKITKELRKNIYEHAYMNHSILKKCENGVDDTMRVWWVQAEAVLGFYYGYQKEPEKREYYKAAIDIWNYIKVNIIHKTIYSEWVWQVDENGIVDLSKPVVSSWKCPYHHGRMCINLLKGLSSDAIIRE